MAEYQLLNDHMTGGISTTVLRREDNAHIPDDPANRDRAEYTAWTEAGGVPDPPDPLPEPAPPAPLTLDAHPAGPMDAVTKLYVDTEISMLRATLLPASGV